MKLSKTLLAAGLTIAAIGFSSFTVFAASTYNSPAEAVAGLTGRTVESVITERVETGKTYGTIANESGKLNEYKAEILEIKKDILKTRVESGLITQEQADIIISAIIENQAVCDGTGTARIGQNMNAGFGSCSGLGLGSGGMNRGMGRGQGRQMGVGGLGIGGMGLRDGSCYNPIF